MFIAFGAEEQGLEGSEYYAVPGGSVESGETIEQTAVREIKEETGLDVTLKRLLAEFENEGRKEHYFVADPFEGEPVFGGPELLKQSDQNVYRLEWIPLTEIGDIPLLPEAIQRAIIDKRG